MSALPDLRPEAALGFGYAAFVARLAAEGLAGDIDTSYATRFTLATDNSAFQQLPAGALFPRDAADIERALALLAEPAFGDVFITPRGGGTSTIGCSLTTGLVLDCSRQMNRIVDIDPAAGAAGAAGAAIVQPDVVLAPYDYCFAPNVAPSKSSDARWHGQHRRLRSRLARVRQDERLRTRHASGAG